VFGSLVYFSWIFESHVQYLSNRTTLSKSVLVFIGKSITSAPHSIASSFNSARPSSSKVCEVIYTIPSPWTIATAKKQRNLLNTKSISWSFGPANSVESFLLKYKGNPKQAHIGKRILH
jgi:hypothetical protein